MKWLKERKINGLKENSMLDIEVMRTKGNVEIAKLEVTNDILKAQNKTLDLEHKNILLQQENSLFDRLKKSGRVLNLLSLLSFAVSTLLSLISGYYVIKNIIKFVGYALTMFVCQIIIFISARYSTVTKEKFTHKYIGLKFMQLSMLVVSIVLNVMFVHSCFKSVLMDIIMLPLCFILDYSTIFFSSLGYDYKSLNFSSNNTANKGNKTIIDMLIDNVFFGFKRKIYNTYYNNHGEIFIKVEDEKPENKRLLEKNALESLEEKTEVKQIAETDPRDEEQEEKPDYRFKSEPITIGEIEIYFNCLLENSKNNVAMGMKKIAEKLEITQYKGQQICKELKAKGYLESRDRETLIVKDVFDKKDFIHLIDVA